MQTEGPGRGLHSRGGRARRPARPLESGTATARGLPSAPGWPCPLRPRAFKTATCPALLHPPSSGHLGKSPPPRLSHTRQVPPSALPPAPSICQREEGRYGCMDGASSASPRAPHACGRLLLFPGPAHCQAHSQCSINTCAGPSYPADTTAGKADPNRGPSRPVPQELRRVP